MLSEAESAALAPAMMMIPPDLPWDGEACNGETYMLQSGIAVMTCGVTTAVPPAERFTFAMVNIDGALPASGRQDVSANQDGYYHPSWHIDEIGNVYGIALNQRTGETFVAASSNYGSGYFGQPGVVRYGNIGGGAQSLAAAGTVYRIDPVTGQASVFAVLPQQAYTFVHFNCEFNEASPSRTTGVGLGNIVYDVYRNQFFVSNAEDGRIYRLDAAGNVVDSYDPLTYDDGAAGPGIFEEQPYGLAIEPGGGRLFFGTAIAPNAGGSPGTGDIPIYSIDLNPDGSFVGTVDNTVLPPGVPKNFVGTETFHTNIGVGSSSGCTFADNTSYMISDLQFGNPGELLVGIRVGCNGDWFSSYNHWGVTALANLGVGNLYDGPVEYYDISVLGACGDDDGYGGVAIWDPINGGNKQYIVSSADILTEAGPHGIAVFDGTAPTGVLVDPLGVISYGLVDSGDPKGVGGDVDVYNGCVPNCVDPIVVVSCDANGTTLPDDDVFYYTIEIPSTGTPGNSYSITADDNQPGLPYDVVNGPFGPFDITDGNLILTIFDDDDLTCVSTITIAAPEPCSDCNLELASVNTVCDNQGTSDPSDDTYTYTIQVNETFGVGSAYNITGDDSQTGLSYGVVEGPFGPFAIGTNLSLTITDDTDASCQLADQLVSSPAACSPVCTINPTITVTCNNEGTTNPLDDTYTYTINLPSSPASGTTYSISGDDTQTGLSYDQLEGPFGPFLINDGNLNITITDDTDGTCNDVAVVTAPAECSDCVLGTPVFTVTCDNQGTFDQSDDTYSYTIQVDETTGLGATYSISGDDSQNNLAYGVVQGPFGPFPLSGGDLSITITDDGDGACQLVDETVAAPAPCPPDADFGDLVDDNTTGSYPTDLTDGAGEGEGACHVIVPGLKLGSTIDNETDGQSSVMADGDDNNGDDEDGVAAPAMIVAGQTATFAITAMNMTNTDEDAFVVGFIDWNGDGDFDDAEETQTSGALFDGYNNTFGMTFNVPVNAVLNTKLGARFRLGTNLADISEADGCTTDGEVEDYTVTVMGFDYGDLADGSSGTGNGDYQTLDPNAGPSHKIVSDDQGNVILKIGASVDADADGQPNGTAGGDDSDGNDDEDGVSLPNFIAGVPASFDVSVMNMTSSTAKLTIFFDWNGNGNFEPSEMYFQDVAVGQNLASFTITPPLVGLFTNNVGVRLRLSTDAVASMSPTGPAPDGEVEDYLALIDGFDYGDLNDNTQGTSGAPLGSPADYQTLTGDNGACHKILIDNDGNQILKIGATVDAEADGQPAADAGQTSGGDDNNSAAGVGPNDEDGLDYANMPMFILTQTTTLNIPVMNMTGELAKLTVYVDFNKNGDFSDAGEMFFVDVLDGQTTASVSIAVPVDAVVGEDLGMRIRLNHADEGMSPVGCFESGEVEDYVVQVIGFDYGDLPDTYTTTGPNAPKHIVNENLKLGSCVDTEIDGIPDAMAGLMGGGDDGDAGLATFGDCDATGDDEDGIEFITPMVPGTTACVEVTAMNMTGSSAVLQGWIDFNGNGAFEASEQLTNGDFSTSGVTVPDGGGLVDVELCFTVPANATFTGGQAMSRWRLSPNGGLGPDGPAGGPFPAGEIEDHKTELAKIGNFVWNDNNGNGLQDESPATGLNGVDIELTWAGADDQFDTSDDAVYPTTTSNMGGADGMFMFTGLTPGAYKVAVVDGPGTPTQINVGTPAMDSDDPAGTMVMIPDPVNLPTGENGLNDNPNDPNYPDANNDLTIDFGFIFLDYGDAPESYSTTDGNDGPAHIVNPDLKLGACVDSDEDGQPEPMAGMMQGGDDNDANSELTEGNCAEAGDDDDGIEFTTPMVPGTTACIEVTAMNMTGAAAVLQGWIDWNGDGTFDPSDALTSGDFAPAGASVPAGGLANAELCFDVPATATFTGGQAITRFRLSEDGGLGYNGPGNAPYPIGEVEDHKVELAKIGSFVWDDYNNDGIQNEPGTAGLNDVTVELIWSGADGVIGTADDVSYTIITSNMNATDGQFMFIGLISGLYEVGIPTFPEQYIPTLIDQTDEDQDSDDPTGTPVIVPDPISLPTLEDGIGDVPNDPNFPDPLNDLTNDFGFVTLDYGDLPDSYETLDGSNGPLAVLNPNLYLGSCVDSEPDGQPEAMAGLMTGGDDGNVGVNVQGNCDQAGADEDGIEFVTPMVPGTTACIEVTAHNATGQPAVLQGWIDWSGNGQFEPNEELTSLNFAPNGLVVPAGGLTDAVVCFEVPDNAVFNEGNAFTRFRLSQNNSLEPGGPATMPFPYGEVEDYKLPLGKVGNYVWEDWNFDGNQDADEPAMNDVPVDLIWAGLDGQIGTADDVTYPTVTGPASGQEDGEYYICGLINGDYKIVILTPELMTPTKWDEGDDVFDSDGEVTNMDLSMVMEEFTIADVTLLPTGENAPGDSGTDGFGTFPDEQVDETHDFGFAFLEYGDLPEVAQGQNFNTTMLAGGPIHVIYPGFKMGATVDPELDGAPEANAGAETGGDDGDNTDDEDGITFATPLIPGFEACLDVDMMNSTGADAVLQGWIDWNGDGQLDASEELNFTNGGVVATGTSSGQYCFPVPADAAFNDGDVFARFRLSRDGGLGPDGPAKYDTNDPMPQGEVEDYFFSTGKIGNLVWEDWNFDGDQDADEPGIDDVAIDLVWAGPDGEIGTADDITYPTVTGPASGQDQGEYYYCGLIEGTYKVIATTPEDMTPAQWDDDPDFVDSDGEVTDMDLSMSMVEITITDVNNLPLAENGNGDNGTAGVGTFPDEQADESIDFGFAFLEYGDLPEDGTNYNTTMAEGGPIHVIYPGFKLGDAVDAEQDGLPDDDAGLEAGGDDDDNIDDENGVAFTTPMIPGNEACIEVTTMNPFDTDAVLQAWIDWNGDGTLDAGEEIVFANGGVVPTGTSTAAEYCFDVPADATFAMGMAYARFRLSRDGGLGPDGPGKYNLPDSDPMPQGEVEDYKLNLAKIGNLLWADDDLEGDQNEPTSNGINDHVVTLIWAGADGLPGTADDREYLTTTANVDGVDGIYYFCGLIEGTYEVRITPYPDMQILTIANLPASDFIDSDGTPHYEFTIDDVTDLVTGENGTGDALANNNWPDNQTDLSIDFGFIPEPTFGSSLGIKGVDFATSGTCGHFDVIMQACVQNTGEVPLNNWEALLDLVSGDGFGTMYLGLVPGGEPTIISSTAQVNPSINANYTGSGSNLLFTGGLLYPGEEVCIELRFELNPEAVGAPLYPEVQMEVTAGAVNYSGVPIPDYLLGLPQYIADDLSDDGCEPDTNNPGEPGDTGGFDDPTPLTDCWESTQSYAANDNVQISVDENCEALVTADMLLEGNDDDCDIDTYPLGGYFNIEILDGLNPVPNPVPAGYFGEELTVKLTHVVTCNATWGTILLEDKLAPVIDCPTEPVEVNCTSDFDDVPPPAALDNCTDVEYHLVDQVFGGEDICDNGFVSVTRTWTATDIFGNESEPCVQTIQIVRPDNIDFPDDIEWECTQYDEYPNIIEATILTGDITTTGSGMPNNGMLEGIYCQYGLNWSDEVVETCGGSFKIFRTWVVSDWCTGEVVTGNDAGEDNVQLIKVVDTTPPVITMADYQVSITNDGAHPQPCTSQDFLPAATITDPCSNYEVYIITPAGEAVYVNGEDGSAGGFIPAPGLEIGFHTITYQALDECGNASELDVTIEVVDDVAPVAICDEITEVTLSSDGLAIVNASVFDDGSYDNCGLLEFQAARMDGDCDGNVDDFGPTVEFCCTDVAISPIMVVFRAVDEYGNFNDCMVEVNVDDKIPPVTTFCPANETISCEVYVEDLAAALDAEDYSVLEGFGTPTFLDNCAVNVEYNVSVNIDNCQEGTIVRSWTANDDNSETPPASCTQTIFVEHVSDWVVEFPADITAECTDGELPEFGEPEIYFDECELIGVSHEDAYFYVVPDACYKIVRTWTAINWCIFDDNGFDVFSEESSFEAAFFQDWDGDGDFDERTFRDGWNTSGAPGTADGYIVYEQTIKVIDEEAPEFVIPEIDGCIVDTDCDTDITIPYPDIMDQCSPSFVVNITIEDVDGNVVAEFDDYQADAEVTLEDKQPGEYTLFYEVTDDCGNTSFDTYDLVVEDCKLPTPYCLNGIVVEIMQTQMIEVWASDLDLGSFDNCPGDLTFSFSPDTDDTAVLYTCDDLGQQEVEIWVTDAAGNQDFCETFITIQDNMDFCSGSPDVVAVAGLIATEEDDPVELVMVDVNGGMQTVFTQADGLYEFILPAGGDYSVTPMLDENPLNGVTTYDMVLISQHILGLLPLDSPYKMIAADANNSGSITTLDLVAIQKLILILEDNFQNNTSWRFVDANYSFPNPNDPWEENFPEVTSFNDLVTDQLQTDFVGVKIGDVNGSAQANSVTGVDNRSFFGDLILQTQEQQLRKGESTEVFFTGADQYTLGYQFTLEVDPSAVVIEEVLYSTATEDNFGQRFLSEGKLTTSWHREVATQLSSEEVVFGLRLRARTDVALSEVLRVSSDLTMAEAYSANSDLLDVQLQVGEVYAGRDEYVLYQNVPNPFGERTTIGFYLPEATSARMVITDVSGRQLKVIEGDYSRGYQEVVVDDLAGSGVYYYRLETPNFQATRKMILK